MSGPMDAYVGPDRRQPMTHVVREPNRRLLATMAIAVLLYGIAVPTGVALILGADGSVQAANLATIVCAILFAQGGLLLLLRWRLTGDSRTCLLGVASLIFGFFVAPMAEVFSLLGLDTARHATAQSLAQTLVGLVAAAYVARGAFVPAVDSRLRPGRTVWSALAALAALCAVGYGLFHLIRPEDHHLIALWAASLAGLTWFVVASLVVWRGKVGMRSLSTLLSAPFYVLGLASVAWVIADSEPVPFSLDASALAMAGALLLAGGAAYALLATLSDQGSSTLRLRSMLRNLEQYRALEEERVHDARSALLAVQTAITALTRYREHLDESARNNLEVAVDAEMDRLLVLMGRVHAEAPAPESEPPRGEVFDVVEPVVTVVTAARTFGVRAVLDAPAEPCKAVGKRDDLARVVETLLGNARRYAPDAPVTVQVRAEAGRVVVRVADRGPGVPEDEREAVFRRGVRGSTATGTVGSGLGLFTARRLMEAAGGSLELVPSRDGGATFVATLPVLTRPSGDRDEGGAGNAAAWRTPPADLASRRVRRGSTFAKSTTSSPSAVGDDPHEVA